MLLVGWSSGESFAQQSLFRGRGRACLSKGITLADRQLGCYGQVQLVTRISKTRICWSLFMEQWLSTSRWNLAKNSPCAD